MIVESRPAPIAASRRVSQLDLLDEHGRHIGGIDFDPMERLLTLGPDGSLYTGVFEPEPHIRRYKVSLSARSP